jgi:two-component system, OmpR family, response regulator
MAAPRILLVEDDLELRAILRRSLAEEGFAVGEVASAAQAIERVESDSPDALIIDIGLPDADGRDLCQALRARGIQSPVLFLTARDALPDRLAGFSAGGDDYLTKPFSLAELTARLRAVLSRAGADDRISSPGVDLDPGTFEASCGERSVRLTPTEFRMLGALAAQPGRVVSRRDLVRVAWPEGAIVHDNTIDVYLARLRRKLRTVSDSPPITTVHGVGYRLR